MYGLGSGAFKPYTDGHSLVQVLSGLWAVYLRALSSLWARSQNAATTTAVPHLRPQQHDSRGLVPHLGMGWPHAPGKCTLQHYTIELWKLLRSLHVLRLLCVTEAA